MTPVIELSPGIGIRFVTQLSVRLKARTTPRINESTTNNMFTWPNCSVTTCFPYENMLWLPFPTVPFVSSSVSTAIWPHLIRYSVYLPKNWYNQPIIAQIPKNQSKPTILLTLCARRVRPPNARTAPTQVMILTIISILKRTNKYGDVFIRRENAVPIPASLFLSIEETKD